MNVFNAYDDVIEAFFTTRHGGESLAPYETLNMAFHVGDNPKHVTANRMHLSAQLGVRTTLVSMEQVHGNRVCCVDGESATPVCDAMMTHERHRALMVMVADCIPILFFDPIHQVIAVAHAGRAGVFENILARTITALSQRYETKPQELLVALGPSIGVCCYEVGSDIAQKAYELGFEAMVIKKKARYYLDLHAIVKQQLRESGIDARSISWHTQCTACNTEDYFSYRKEGITGRFCGVVMIK